MARQPIVVPFMGEAVSEAVLTCWRTSVGERVEAGRPLAELEGDKATFEITAEWDGVLLSQNAREGQAVRPGQVLGELEATGGGRAAAAVAHRAPPAVANREPEAVRPARPEEPVWEVRIFELPYGVERLVLEPGWEPFAALEGRRILARRRYSPP